MMKQATTYNTNTARRAHPAVVRAALRSCKAKHLRQTDTGYRWNEPHANWIEYNLAGEIKAYGNRNGTIASFLYSGPPSILVTTTSSIISGGGSTTKPSSEGRITGILDHTGIQALWFDYDTNNRLTRIRAASGRQVQYQWTYTDGDAYNGIGPGITLSVLDANGNSWSYVASNIAQVIAPSFGTSGSGGGGSGGGITAGSSDPIVAPDSDCKLKSNGPVITITDPAGRITSRSWRMKWGRSPIVFRA